MVHRLLISGLAFGLACVPTYRDIELEGGWGGVSLGSAPSDLQGGKLLRDDGVGGAIYIREGETRTYGTAPVGGVRYHFWDDELYKIEVRTGSSKGFLLKLTEEYGTPSYFTPWQWGGEKVRMNFRGNEHDNAALLLLVHPATEARVEVERPERLRKAEQERRAREAEEERRAKEAEEERALTESEPADPLAEPGSVVEP